MVHRTLSPSILASCTVVYYTSTVSIFGRPHSKGSIPRGMSTWALRKSASFLAHSPGTWIWFGLTFQLARPLNPVLGELFYGHWPDQGGRGRTTLVVEQVSHHPPITAYVIENKAKGLSLTGHNAQKTSFSSGAIIVKQIGHAILTIDLGEGKKEEVLITLPKLRIDGLWYGSPYIELWDKTNIQSSSGWSSVVSPHCPHLVPNITLLVPVSSSIKARDISRGRSTRLKQRFPRLLLRSSTRSKDSGTFRRGT